MAPEIELSGHSLTQDQYILILYMYDVLSHVALLFDVVVRLVSVCKSRVLKSEHMSVFQMAFFGSFSFIVRNNLSPYI